MEYTVTHHEQHNTVESGYNEGFGGGLKKICYMRKFVIGVKLVQSATRGLSLRICCQSPTCRQNAHPRAGVGHNPHLPVCFLSCEVDSMPLMYSFHWGVASRIRGGGGGHGNLQTPPGCYRLNALPFLRWSSLLSDQCIGMTVLSKHRRHWADMASLRTPCGVENMLMTRAMGRDLPPVWSSLNPTPLAWNTSVLRYSWENNHFGGKLAFVISVILL